MDGEIRGGYRSITVVLLIYRSCRQSAEQSGLLFLETRVRRVKGSSRFRVWILVIS